MRLRTFFGFLSPGLRYSGKGLPVEDFPLSPRHVLLIKHGVDKAESAALSVGDSVKSGQPVLSSEGRVLAYSSATGSVTDIKDIRWLDGDEYTAVGIETSGEDDWELLFDGGVDYNVKKPGEVLSLLKEAGFETGISEAGGMERVVVNCLEGDILVSVRRSILSGKGNNISEGIGLLKHITGSDDIILAVPADLAGAAGDIAGGAGISVVKPVYPAGMDEILLRNLKIAGEAGRKEIVISVEYLNAMVESLKSGKPFIEKVVTLIDTGGRCVKNIRVRTGTPAGEILRANGIEAEGRGRLVLGGPMRGRAVYDIDFPVTRDTDAILVQGSDEVYEISSMSCVNCGECVKVCPNKLQVNLLSRYSEYSLFEKCEELDISYCIECGLCSYVCTSKRPVLQFIQFAKEEIKQLKKEEAEKSEKEESV